MTISLCMIVKNEEKVLARCLESAKDIADEIIIVDTGSTDETKSVAKRFTDNVYDFVWINDFSAARNFAFEKATMAYQMWLDADDVIPEESQKEILSLKEEIAGDIDIVTMKYITHFDDNGNPTLTSTRERLFKRNKKYKWEDPIHEVIPMIGNVLHTNIYIHHKKEKTFETSTRNIEIYESLEKNGHIFTPRQLYYYARELKDHGQWAKSAYYFERFLETKEGWKEDNIASAFNLSIIYEILKQDGKILNTLVKSFTNDIPRPEICCRLGYFYKNKKDYAMALKWFQMALDLPKDVSVSGFVLQDYIGYIPNIEACVCSYHLGDIQKAIDYNEEAAKFKTTKAVEINREVFSKL